VHIVGSITSNSYGDDSDIDLHFYSPDIPKSTIEELNTQLR